MAMARRTKHRDASALVADGFSALVEKLGMADAVRYVQLMEPNRGDYTRDRHEWLDNLSDDEIARSVKKAQKKQGKRGSK